MTSIVHLCDFCKREVVTRHHMTLDGEMYDRQSDTLRPRYISVCDLCEPIVHQRGYIRIESTVIR